MDLTLYRCHDYAYLVERWRKIARATGLKMRRFAQTGDYPLYALVSRHSPNGGIYVSAGIHGDEPAGTEALLRWAESHLEAVRSLPLVIIPCLNPWGLVHNTRLDAHHRDLNRSFHLDELPEVAGVKALIAPYRFAVALNLHEDYDAQGFYLYEVSRVTPYWGESLIDVARPLIPIDQRKRIEGRRVTVEGVVRPKLNLKRFPMIPEAVHLHQHHSDRTFTFETPSEFALEHRVRVQIALIQECICRVPW